MDPIKHVQHLTQDIGPRPPTSPNEARGSAYCARVLEEAGLEVTVEPFRGLRSFGDIYIPITSAMLTTAGMGMAKKARRIKGLALGSAALAAFWGENTTRWRPLTRLRANRPSQNVVGILRARSDTRRRLVCVAHVDSSRSGWAFSPSMAPSFHRNASIGLCAAIAAAVAWLLPRPIRRLAATISAGVIGSSLAMLIQREVAGKDVEGANDNASGVGVLLAIAEELAAGGLNHTEVWFVVTGCEESDRIGMDAFLDRHTSDLEDAYFLGFDTVGGSNTSVCWVTDSGMLESLDADRYLTSAAAQTAASRPDLGARPGTWHSAGLDTDNAIARGFKAMSIVALTEQGTLPDWHWPTDTSANLDQEAVLRCFEFSLDLIKVVDAEA